ncbi:hypothetical protein TIFTF001_035639 [Ficus carica]|uniref:Uncharacterized protein n=1 Tax=Ficus carica TaxID=3494 RepID=A0AA88E5Y7_FICCA|nr:hypothetical protein TIFTF001_035639 [Ficus carica]
MLINEKSLGPSQVIQEVSTQRTHEIEPLEEVCRNPTVLFQDLFTLRSHGQSLQGEEEDDLRAQGCEQKVHPLNEHRAPSPNGDEQCGGGQHSSNRQAKGPYPYRAVNLQGDLRSRKYREGLKAFV